MPKYEELACEFIAAIRDLAAREDARNNMESYLSYHFPVWFEKFVVSPAGLVSELRMFADMYEGNA